MSNTWKGLKGDYYGKTVIIATGAHPSLLSCPGEKEFTGKRRILLRYLRWLVL